MAIGKCVRREGNPGRCTIANPAHPLCEFTSPTCAYSLPDDMRDIRITSNETVVVAAATTITSPSGSTYALTAGQELTTLETEKNGVVKVLSATKILIIPVNLVRRKT